MFLSTRLLRWLPVQRICTNNSTRSISNYVEIKGLGKHVTKEKLLKKALEYGPVVAVKTDLYTAPSGKKLQHGVITFYTSTAAFAFIDELDDTVLFGDRYKMDFFHPDEKWLQSVPGRQYLREKREQRMGATPVKRFGAKNW